MGIRIKQRLAIRHARYILLLSLSIGLFSSLLQVYLDLLDERTRQIHEIEKVLSFHTDAATQAVYNLDEDVSKNIVESIVSDKRFYKASIIDDFGDVLATSTLDKPETATWLLQLSDSMLDIPDHFVSKLALREYSYFPGRVEVWVDVSFVAKGFARRAITTAFTGLLSTSLLTLILLIVLYRGLSKPIMDISRWVEKFSSRNQLTKDPYSRDDELGDLVTCFKEAWQERDDAEAQIHKLAYFDSLTQLPNRRLLIEMLTRDIESHAATKLHGAVMYFDIDRFKTINDSLGHSIGDLLLCEIGKRVLEVIPKSATCARFGGDEYVVLLSDMGLNREACSLAVKDVASTLLKRLSEPMEIEGNVLHCTVSIGIALFPEKGNTCLDIIRRADTALYGVKAAGRNGYQFFDQEMQRVASQQLSIVEGIHVALAEQQFELWFQPQLDAKGRTTAAEALIRWRHPVQGLVYPNDFLEVAEESGQIKRIGLWVIEEACRLLAGWRTTGLPECFERVSINVSPSQFIEGSFIARVIEILERHDIPGSMLEFEITENMLIRNFEIASTKMATLKELGITFAIDDFGTGYSSLKYLSNLPLDVLKIDRSFVTNLHQESSETSIVELIMAMAQKLDLRVIAEGVSSVAEKECLDQLGCRFYQGFLFSRPLKAELFYKDLKEDRYIEHSSC
ncbi:putative bifunctional diguanylate cyclase/phosphodiesterase [Marinomonas mediterranea]|jgi:diguanylate cyclase (GGDEF) domain|uniref:Diguanylate cyclase/phosphodiesterase n=1 Tax=Marinomonas mediterranea (strain ATCC 700492 / JCM 21426 / NBRC 103028 / MMB-1) TaxID=717774 RepID=F2JZY1_MARM1|nr:EAL domain-containing protein [Marinomonas mediterranea]ADZ92093.1 diguanylate cyclase/phosphodiesterase [Marinomonas mediterranea MMB-1]WCN10054.1 EAL domain-containing protein [Marinomonas mediterranea]WCN14105.1 EAL domain-containing protein [Marinomonas mediterranea]WCN18160.1 EAL domain-containing protein [Marinomonas mediterranea MMB-1]